MGLMLSTPDIPVCAVVSWECVPFLDQSRRTELAFLISISSAIVKVRFYYLVFKAFLRGI